MENVLGTYNVLHIHCHKFSQTLDALQPFQHKCTQPYHQSDTSNGRRWCKLATHRLSATCKSYKLMQVEACLHQSTGIFSDKQQAVTWHHVTKECLLVPQCRFKLEVLVCIFHSCCIYKHRDLCGVTCIWVGCSGDTGHLPLHIQSSWCFSSVQFHFKKTEPVCNLLELYFIQTLP